MTGWFNFIFFRMDSQRLRSRRLSACAVAAAALCLLSGNAYPQQSGPQSVTLAPSLAPAISSATPPVTPTGTDPTANPTQALGTVADQITGQISEPSPSFLPQTDEPKPHTHAQKLAFKKHEQGEQDLRTQNLDAAESRFAEAVQLDPSETKYLLAHELVRQQLVSALLANANHAQLTRDTAGAAAAIAKAHQLDPQNPLVEQAVNSAATSLEPAIVPNGDEPRFVTGELRLDPKPGLQSFHMRSSTQDILQRVFSAYGISTTLDASVSFNSSRLDVDNVKFEDAARIASLLTNTFFVVLDTHRVLIAKNTPDLRNQFERLFLETVYLPGLSKTEMSDTTNLVKQVFNVKQVTVDEAAASLSLRAPLSTLLGVNRLLTDLFAGHGQMLLELKLYSIDKTHTIDLGVNGPQQFTLFNVDTEIQSILNQNQSLVQELISSGAVQPGDLLGIAALLIASGAVNGSVLGQPFALFGGGLTQTGLATSGLTLNFALNSSNVRRINRVQMRVGNLETATFRDGTRYPIITSSFSSQVSSTALTGALASLNIPGLSALLGSAGGIGNITPQIQYQDLGLTLKVTPRILNSRDISMNLEFTLSSLAGGAINNLPILANREYKGSINMKADSTTAMVAYLSRSESNALSGLPGLNDIPGFAATNKNGEKDSTELVILLTPHLLRVEHPQQVGPLILLGQ